MNKSIETYLHNKNYREANILTIKKNLQTNVAQILNKYLKNTKGLLY